MLAFDARLGHIQLERYRVLNCARLQEGEECLRITERLCLVERKVLENVDSLHTPHKRAVVMRVYYYKR